MLVSFGMDATSMVEDILSDEYEEGEILDDDILYENVSSLEEFSDVDDKKPSPPGVKTTEAKKTKRKKEHKCKMDSLCRVERSGKHCYARIRKRRSSLELKSSRMSGNSEGDCDKKQRPPAKSISPNRGFKRDAFVRGKADVRKRGLPYYFQHDNRLQPSKKVFPDRRCKKNRRLSVEDQRNGNRRRKSRSASPKRPVEAGRSVTKSSLLERLVGSGSIPVKTSASETDAKTTYAECDSELSAVPTDPNSCPDSECDRNVTPELCPADIPIPPASKAQSPKPQEIEELHLRLNALKTAIIKKHTDLKRKKRLAASKKRDSVEDSFTEFALSGLLDDESIPTPPPPGTDWPAPLDDNRWSDEDMVIDQEGGEIVIESNIPASDPSLQNLDYLATSSPSSHDILPCCRGNPIPVITPHRPAKETEPVKKPSSVVPLVFDPAPASGSAQTPKYLKEINSNKLMRRRGRRSQSIKSKGSLGWNPRRRRNSLRQGLLKLSVKSVTSSKAIKEDDDEDELRKLALMSVKPKNTIKGGMLTSVGTDLNPLSIDTDQPAAAEKADSPVKEQSPAEPWDDLDEDILRAQLLSSLSRNIPVQTDLPQMHSPVEAKKQVLTKKINKENVYTRRNVVASKPQKKNPAKFVNPNVKPSLTPPLHPPKMEKFIIKVSDSETSEDEEMKAANLVNFTLQRKSEIELSIDRLLAETRKESELIQQAMQFYPEFTVPEACQKMPPENVTEGPIEIGSTLTAESALSPEEKIVETLPSSSAIHPQGLSHLPAWQQEEFERQKRVMAHKSSLIEATKQKIRLCRSETASVSTDDSAVSAEESKLDSANSEATRMESDTPSVPTSTLIVDSTSEDLKETCESSAPEEIQDVESNSMISAVQKLVDELLTKVCSEPQKDSSIAAILITSSSHGNHQGESARIITERKNPPKVLPLKAKIPSKNEPQLNPRPPRAVCLAAIPAKGSALRTSLRGPLKNPGLLKKTPAAAVKPIANGLVSKAPFVFKDSSYASKVLNEMVGMVNAFESGMSEYKNLKKDYIAFRKQLVLAHQRMSKKRQGLLDVKRAIENKRKLLDSTLTMDTSSLSPLPDLREQPKLVASMYKFILYFLQMLKFKFTA